MRILKYRGQRYRGGYHDFTIKTGGIQVFLRLVAAEHHKRFKRTQLSTGIGEFDALLGGGHCRRWMCQPGRLTSLLWLLRPSGLLQQVSSTQVRVLGLLFDRMKGLGIDLEGAQEAGQVVIEQIDAAELSPGEYTHRVCKVVDDKQFKTPKNCVETRLSPGEYTHRVCKVVDDKQFKTPKNCVETRHRKTPAALNGQGFCREISICTPQ